MNPVETGHSPSLRNFNYPIGPTAATVEHFSAEPLPAAFRGQWQRSFREYWD
jgi:hypothetical protein